MAQKKRNPGAVRDLEFWINNGNPSFESLTVTGNAAVRGNLTVSGSGTFASLVVTGTAAVGVLTVSGAATVGSLTVTGNAAVRGNLTVSGSGSFASLTVSGLAAVGSLTVSGNGRMASLTVTGAAAVGSLTVSAGATVGSLTVTGNATINGGLVVSGGISTNSLTVTGLATLNSLTVVGAAQVGGNLTVSGNTALNGNVTVSGTLTVEDSIVLGGVTINLPVVTPTVTTTTDGTFQLTTSIASWARKVSARLKDLSTNGTNNIIMQLGTITGYVTSGYDGGLVYTPDAAANSGQANSNGFRITQSWTAAASLKGVIELEKEPDTNTWIAVIRCARDNGSAWAGAGSVTLPGTLTSIQFLPVVTGDNFDGGRGSTRYEY